MRRCQCVCAACIVLLSYAVTLPLPAVAEDATEPAPDADHQFLQNLEGWCVDKLNDLVIDSTGIPEEIWQLVMMQYTLTRESKGLIESVDTHSWDYISRHMTFSQGEYGIYNSSTGVYDFYPCSLFRPYLYNSDNNNFGLQMSGTIAYAPHFVLTATATISGNTEGNYLYMPSAPSNTEYGFVVQSHDWARPGSYYITCDTDFFQTYGGVSSEIAYFPCGVSMGSSVAPIGYTSTHNNSYTGVPCSAGSGGLLVVDLPAPAQDVPNSGPEDYYYNTLEPYMLDWAELNAVTNPDNWIYNGVSHQDPTEPQLPIATLPAGLLPPITIATDVVYYTDAFGETYTETVPATMPTDADDYIYKLQVPTLPALPMVDDTLPLDIDMPPQVVRSMGGIWSAMYDLLSGTGLLALVAPAMAIGILIYIITRLGG